MLTEEQAGTIEEPDEYKLICALPGSGKTFTSVSLAEKILELKPEYSVLMVTFTNASAGEMKDRLETRLGKKDSRRTKSSTFASLMIAQFKQVSKGRKPIIGAEQYLFVKRALIAEKQDTGDIDEWMSKVEEIGRDINHQFNGLPSSVVFQRYCEILHDHRRYDLNMMGRELIIGIKDGTINSYKHTHIICDEFQDSDNLQYLWLKAHGDKGAKLACVGDDDQAIYSWRGSMGFKAFQIFQEDFNASAYLLSKCFRCAPEILKSAKGFVENNEERLDKEMSSMVKEKGIVMKVPIPPEFISKYLQNKVSQDTQDVNIGKGKNKKELTNKEKENFETYRYVAEKINDSEEHGWAILARTNKQLDLMERALSELQVKAIRIGGKSIFDNLHAVSMVNLFFGLIFDNAASELVSGLGWTGESEINLKTIDNQAKQMGFSSASQIGGQEWSKVTSYMQEQSILARQCTTEEHAKKFVTKWGKVMIQVVKKMDDREKNLQLTVLDILLNILDGSKGDLKAHAINLVNKTRKIKGKQDVKDKEAVILATMNSSKGLEWERVWICQVEQGTIPMLKDKVTIEAIEEERRLMYVAMTRAEKELYLSYKESAESAFLEEIEAVVGGMW
jgi:superfamily I DNA/RNA helicase